MAGYTRQSTFADGDTITAALFNNEYNQLLNAFSNTGGHKHDGTANEGPVIGLIGDAGETAPNNKVLIDTTNNYIEFWIDVSSSSVQQLYIADGAIIPVTDSDIDLGTTSLRFKDTYTDTVTTTGNVSIGGDLTVTGSATISGNLTFGDADTDSINLAAEIDSDIIPNTDGTYDLGSATKEWQDLYIDGTANIDSLVADTADINGGTIDGATIATSDITVGAGKTLNVSAGTLTLADDQISGDKVEGGTIAATTVTTLTSTTGNITTVNSTTTNATTVDSTNLEVTNLKAKDGTSAGSIADSTGVVTLASSVLTTTDINGGTIDGATIGGTTAGAVTFTDLSDGTITIAGFADEDNMVSNSATLLPTQQSVKAYVDSQVTAQDLDFQGDTGGALSIDLDSESLTIAGGTGLDTVGSGNTVTVNIDSTVTTLTGSQTLTNKTLTTPVISSISNTGTLTLPTSTDTLVGRATTDTLTNKTLTSATLTSPVINTGVSGTAFLDDDTFATATASTLASSESIKAYVDTTVAATNEVVEDTTPQLGGDLDLNSSDITGTGNINITGTIQSSGNITGTLATAAQPNITSLGTLTGLTTNGTTPTLLYGNQQTISNLQGLAIYNNQSGGLLDTTLVYGNSTNSYFAIGHHNGTSYTERFRIASGGDISFYEDTGTSQALFWDASAESLGIGNTSPAAPLDIKLNTNSTADIFKFQRLDGAVAGVLNYSGTDGAISLGTTTSHDLTFDTANTERLRIDSSGNVGIGTDSPTNKLDVSGAAIRLTNGTNATAQMLFGPAAISDDYAYLAWDNTIGSENLNIYTDGGIIKFSANAAEAMRIDSSGNVLVGTTSDTAHVTSASGEGIALSAGSYGGFIGATRNSDVVLEVNRTGTAGDIVKFRGSGSLVGSIGTNLSDLTIGTGDTGAKFVDGFDTIVPFNTTTNSESDGVVSFGASENRWKDLYLSGGAYLGGTGSANHLDDYEEGTWTPTYDGSTSATGVTYSQRTGSYTKIGNTVTVSCNCVLSNKGTVVGVARISGLPFAGNNNPPFHVISPMFGNLSLASDGTEQGTGAQYAVNSFVYLFYSNIGGALTQMTATHVNNNSDFHFTLTYMTDS